MKRRLFTILSAVSLLLFVAVVVLWVRSLSRVEIASMDLWRHSLVMNSAGGLIGLRWDHYPVRVEAKADWLVVRKRSLRVVWLSFGASHETVDRHPYGKTMETSVHCPYWLPATMTATLPVMWGWRLLRSGARRLSGLCLSCGYDLRATPQRCPECGTTSPLAVTIASRGRSS